MSSILVFISSKAFNSPPRQTSALADPPRFLNQEIKWRTDSEDMWHDVDDAAMDLIEVEEFWNVSGRMQLQHVVACVCLSVIILTARQT